jgi:O-antigen/teichoic acid export membrane protein
MAFELANAPTRFLSPMVTRVALPIFARRKHDDGALSRGFIDMSAMLAWVQYPLLALLGVFGSLVVAVVLGAQWGAVAPVLVPLALYGGLRVLANATGPIFLTKGRVDLSFAWNVFAAVLGATVLYLAVGSGILSVARAWVGLMLFHVGVLMLLMRHLIGLRPTTYFRELVKPVLATAAAASAAFATSLLVQHWMSSQLGLLVASAGVGAVVYMGAAWLLAPSLIVGIVRAARGRQGIPS